MAQKDALKKLRLDSATDNGPNWANPCVHCMREMQNDPCGSKCPCMFPIAADLNISADAVTSKGLKCINCYDNHRDYFQVSLI